MPVIARTPRLSSFSCLFLQLYWTLVLERLSNQTAYVAVILSLYSNMIATCMVSAFFLELWNRKGGEKWRPRDRPTTLEM